MTLLEEIERICLEFDPQPLYLRADEWETNAKLDRLPKVSEPVIVAYNYPTVTHTIDLTGKISRNYPMLIWFMKFSPNSSSDPNTVQIDILQEEMRLLAERFIVKLNASTLINPIVPLSGIVTNPVIMETDSGMSGVQLSFNVNVISTATLCHASNNLQ